MEGEGKFSIEDFLSGCDSELLAQEPKKENQVPKTQTSRRERKTKKVRRDDISGMGDKCRLSMDVSGKLYSRLKFQAQIQNVSIAALVNSILDKNLMSREDLLEKVKDVL